MNFVLLLAQGLKGAIGMNWYSSSRVPVTRRAAMHAIGHPLSLSRELGRAVVDRCRRVSIPLGPSLPFEGAHLRELLAIRCNCPE